MKKKKPQPKWTPKTRFKNTPSILEALAKEGLDLKVQITDSEFISWVRGDKHEEKTSG